MHVHKYISFFDENVFILEFDDMNILCVIDEIIITVLMGVKLEQKQLQEILSRRDAS